MQRNRFVLGGDPMAESRREDFIGVVVSWSGSSFIDPFEYRLLEECRFAAVEE